MAKLTFAVCTYNRADALPDLVKSIRSLECPIPWEILFIDNNSSDATQQVLGEVAKLKGTPLRFVKEAQQGIPYARNRAVQECLSSDFMVFIDDDERPQPGFLEGAVDALSREGAECFGGKVINDFSHVERPEWLTDDLLGFLAEVNHGDEAFWIEDASTPVWTANVGYRMSIFRDDPELRFDTRYNRIGKGIGGGSDAIMFRELVTRKIKIRYRPDIAVLHNVDAWRLKRSYFLKLHFVAGRKHGQYQCGPYAKSLFGVPPFLLRDNIVQLYQTLKHVTADSKGALRQGMNFTHSVGTTYGRFLAWRSGE